MKVRVGRASTIYIDPYVTRDYKIFVEGARVDEVPMPGRKSTLADFGIQVRHGRLRRPRRKMYRRLSFGAVPGYSPICFDTNDPLTVKTGCEQRVLRVNPPPVAQELAQFNAFCKKKFEKWFSKSLGQATQIGFEEWLNSLQNVNELRKFQFEQANLLNRGGPPPLSIARKVVCFIKTEFYSTFKYPRWIMSRKDQFKVLFGPIVKAMEAVVYQRPEFVKHISMADRAERVSSLNKAGRRFYIADFSSFESSFLPSVMAACEFELMRTLVPWWVWTHYCENVLAGTNRLTIQSLFVLVYVLGRRMSGEMSTSLFNGITNLMLTKYIVHKKKGHVDILVEGDDSIFSSTVEITPKDYEDLGFTAKVVEVTSPTCPIPLDTSIEPGSIAFCGITFSNDGQAMREPRKFLQGFGWTHSFIHSGPWLLDQLLRAKALSACYESPNCPIVGVMAREALRQVGNVTIEQRVVNEIYNVHAAMGYEAGKLFGKSAVPEFNPTFETRECFAKCFGVGIETQLEVEAAIRAGDMVKVSQLIPPTFDQLFFTSRYVVAA